LHELAALAEQLGQLAGRCTDPQALGVLRDAERILLEAVRDQALLEVSDRGGLARLITETCHKPGHAVVLLDLLGQTWVGYAGAARTYVARPPSRHQVLEAIAEAGEQWRPVDELEPVRFPMLALHVPALPVHTTGVRRPEEVR